MARPIRIEYPGALYHITSRGNAGEPIFLEDKEKLQEIPRIQRFAARPSLQELFSESSSDPEVVMKAYTYYHYTLKEIGNYLGMHYATASRLVKRYKISVSRRGENILKNKT